MTPAEQLAAIAAATRAGYDFTASDLVAIDGDCYEFADEQTGYRYWITEAGDVHTDAPWQLRA